MKEKVVFPIAFCERTLRDQKITALVSGCTGIQRFVDGFVYFVASLQRSNRQIISSRVNVAGDGNFAREARVFNTLNRIFSILLKGSIAGFSFNVSMFNANVRFERLLFSFFGFVIGEI